MRTLAEERAQDVERIAHRSRPRPRALRRARRDRRRAAWTTQAAPPARAGAARLPPQRRRPRRRRAGPAARDRRAAHRARPGLLPRDPRRRPLGPAAARAARRAARRTSSTAHPADADGLVTITTDYPDYMPFRTFAADARRAPRARRSSSSTAAGRPTTPSCTRCSTCAREKAGCSATASWPDYDAEVKMIGTGAGDRRVHRADRRRCRAAGAARLADVLLERQRQDDPATPRFDASDFAYYAELVRREQLRRRRAGGAPLLRLRQRARAACST